MKKSTVVNRSGGVETEDGRELFGLDAETYLKDKARENPEFERKCGEWIEDILNEKLEDTSNLWKSLKSGVALCRVANAIKPGAIHRYNNRSALHPFMERENISLYLDACWRLGISSSEIFITTDLYNRRSIGAVLKNLVALSMIAPEYGNVKVPPIDPNWKPLSALPAPSKYHLETQSGPIYTAELEADDKSKIEDLIKQLEATKLDLVKLETARAGLQIDLSNAREQIRSLKQLGPPKPLNPLDMPIITPRTNMIVEEKTRDLQTEIAKLKKELASERITIQEKDEEIVKKLTDIKQYTQELTQLKENLLKDTKKVEENSNQNKNKILQLKLELAQTVKKAHAEKQQLQRQVSQMLREKTEIARKYDQVKSEFDKEISRMQSERVNKGDEIDNLKSTINQKSEEIEKLLTGSSSLEYELNVVKSEFIREKEDAKASLQIFESKIASLAKEKEELVKKSSDEINLLQNQLNELSNKEAQKKFEIKELSSMIVTREKEKEEIITELNILREKISKSENTTEIELLKEQEKLKSVQIEKLNEVIDSLAHEKERASGIVTELWTKILKLEEETKVVKTESARKLQIYENQIEDLSTEKDEKEQEISQLTTEIEALSEQTRDNQNTIETLQNTLEKERNNKQKEIQALQDKLLANKEKFKTVEDALQHFENLLNKQRREYQNLEDEKDMKINSLNKIIEELQSQIQDFEKKSKKLENKALKFEQEKIFAETEADTQVTVLKNKIVEYKGQIETITEQYSARMRNYKQEMDDIMAQNQVLLLLKDEEIQELNEKVNSVENQVSSLKKKLNRAKEKLKLAEKTPEEKIKSLEDENKELEKKNKTLLEQIKKLENESKRSVISNIIHKAESGISKKRPKSGEGDRPSRKLKREAFNKGLSIDRFLEGDTQDVDLLVNLRTQINDKIFGNVVPDEDDVEQFATVLKSDSGRRIFYHLLQSFVREAKSKTTELTPESFDLLVMLVMGTLDVLKLARGGDYICAKVIVEISSALYTRIEAAHQGREYLQEIIMNHHAWQNLFFWEEYFWDLTAQIVPWSLTETENTKKSRREFLFKHIKSFAKKMIGWGNLPSSSIQPFIKTLSEEVGLGKENLDKLYAYIEKNNATYQKKASKRIPRARSFSTSTIPQIQPSNTEDTEKNSLSTSHNHTRRNSFTNISAAVQQSSPTRRKSRIGVSVSSRQITAISPTTSPSSPGTITRKPTISSFSVPGLEQPVKVLTIHLSDVDRKTVLLDNQNVTKTLREILAKVCDARDMDVNNYDTTTLKGDKVPLETKLGDIETQEVIMKKKDDTVQLTIEVSSEDKKGKKTELAKRDKMLRPILEKFCDIRGWKITDFKALDINKKDISFDCLISEIEGAHVILIDN